MIWGLTLLVIYPQAQQLWLLAPAVVLAWAGVVTGTYPLEKQIFPPFSFAHWFRYVCAMRVLRFGTLVLLIAAAVLMPEQFGWASALLACSVLGFQVAMHFGLWLWMAARLGILTPAKHTERITAIVSQTAERMKVPYRSIWILQAPVGYAAALPATRDLIFSAGLLESHLEEEMAAICAHELAHLTETRNTVLVRVVGSLSLLPLIFVRPVVNAFGFLGIWMLLLPWALLSVHLRHLGRRMDVRADAIAEKCEVVRGVYARALERLYRDNQMPAVMPGNRYLHPHLYDRLVSAGVTPDYPRPDAPASLNWSTGLMLLLLVILLIVLLANQQSGPPSWFGS